MGAICALKTCICIAVAFGFLLPAVSTAAHLAHNDAALFPRGLSQHADYVVIAPEEHAAALAGFISWKASCGYSPRLVTTAWIDGTYDGIDEAEKIRNFLVDTYQEWGIDYVLLVGTRASIPMRSCYINPFNHSDAYAMIPTDYYYADLTGDWDADGDGYYGECWHDRADLYPEVWVGRIPSDDMETIRGICNKTVAFEQDTGAWKHNVLQLGAILFYQGYENVFGVWNRSDGATLMERCRTDIFSSAGYMTTCLYEEAGLQPSTYAHDMPLNHSNVVAAWTQGYGVVSMLGHASNTKITRLVWDNDDGDNVPEYPGELEYISFLGISDSDRLTCETPPIVYTSGCHQLYTSRNIGRAFIEDGAAVAFIGSTDMSWYNVSMIWEDERDGGCMSMHYDFFRYLVAHGQKCGNALYNAKASFYTRFMFPGHSLEWMLRCYGNLYGFNLYGDPSLGLTAEKIDGEPPEVELERPNQSLYILDTEIRPSFFGGTVILGDITLTGDATDTDSGTTRVEVYIDNGLKATTPAGPLAWTWDEAALGRYTIKMVAHDAAGNIAGDTAEVFILNS